MTIENGHNGHNGNGNGKPGMWDGFARKELGPFWASELVSAVVLPVGVYVMEQLPPSLIKYTSKAVGKCLEPVLEPLEKGLGFICKLDECKPDLTKSREERAENMGRILTVFAPPAALTYVLKIWFRRYFGFEGPKHSKSFNPLHMTGKEWMLVATDEGAHIALMGAIQGPFARQGDEAIRSLTSVFEKSGIPKHTAHELAAALVIHEGPNIGGAIIGSGGLALNRLLSGSTHAKP